MPSAQTSSRFTGSFEEIYSVFALLSSSTANTNGNPVTKLSTSNRNKNCNLMKYTIV